MGQNHSHHRSPNHTPPTNYDLPPLNFHTSHGQNITLSQEGALATRRESYCKGILFSHRPVMVGERVCMRINELSSRWSGVIRVGFCAHDPTPLQGRLPKYACPDLTNKSGFWAKALSDRCIETNAIIHYYVSAHGDVHFGINGGDLGIFFSGVDTRQPLWAMIDLYGNCTSIELVDARRTVNNFSRTSGSSTGRSSQRSQRTWPNVPTHHIMPAVVALPPAVVVPQNDINSRSSRPMYNTTSNNAVVDSGLSNQMSSLAINRQAQRPASTSPPSNNRSYQATATRSASSLEVGTVPTLKYNQGIRFQAMTFHPSVGKSVKLDGSATVAGRHDDEFAQGYAFSRHNITPGERIVIQVLANEDSYIGSLAFGLTNCDPGSFDVRDLPEDSDLLLDRPEYWVVSKDVANSPAVGDELSFTVKTDGSVEFSRNNMIPSTFMHVDVTLPLWAFWDIYGHTSRIRILGSCSQSVSRQVSATTLPPNTTTEATLVPVETAQEAGDALNASFSNTSECTICYERPVDCVLYTCGHMCMCYECALQQWRGRGGGICPMCRMSIRDVIRTFRS
jgi:protein neuralized